MCIASIGLLDAFDLGALPLAGPNAMPQPSRPPPPPPTPAQVLSLNSFEQLCINYCNERLQAHYVACTAQEEERLHKAEGLPWVPPHRGEAGDNAAVLLVLEGKGGVFGTLDSTCRMRNADDQAFNRSLLDAHPKSEVLRPPRAGRAAGGLRPDEGFSVAHFHASVQYATEGWVEKNRDALSASLLDVVRARADALRCAWLPAAAAAAATSLPASLPASLPTSHRAAEVPRKAQSISEKYRARLKELLAELTPSRRHAYFVKCVKPNAELRPRAPQPAVVLRQLQRQGVLQGVALIKRGFPHRIGYADVHGRYAPLLQRLGDSGQPHLAKLAALPPRALVEAVLASQGLHAPTEYVLGRERVFLRLGKAALLEKMLARPPEEVPPRQIVTSSHRRRVAPSPLRNTHLHPHPHSCTCTRARAPHPRARAGQVLPDLVASLEDVQIRRKNRAVIARAVMLFVLRRRAQLIVKERRAVVAAAAAAAAAVAEAAAAEAAAAEAAAAEAAAAEMAAAEMAAAEAAAVEAAAAAEAAEVATAAAAAAKTKALREKATGACAAPGGKSVGRALDSRGAYRQGLGSARAYVAAPLLGGASVRGACSARGDASSGPQVVASRAAAARARRAARHPPSATRVTGASRRPPPGVEAVAAQLEPQGSRPSEAVVADLVLEVSMHRLFFSHWSEGWHFYDAAPAALSVEDAALLAGRSPPWPGGTCVVGALPLVPTPSRGVRLPATPAYEDAAAEGRAGSLETRKLLGGADGARARFVRRHLHAIMYETAPHQARVRNVLGLGVIMSCVLCYVVLLGGRGQSI